VDENRLVLVFVTPEFFTQLPGVWHRVDSGLPHDAKLAGHGYDSEREAFYFKFSHPKFPPIAECEKIPEFCSVDGTVFHFESPASEAAIADINRLTKKQIAVHKVEDKQFYTLSGDRVLPAYDVKTLAGTHGEMDFNSDTPLVAGE
jgi:hypothetical protein